MKNTDLEAQALKIVRSFPSNAVDNYIALSLQFDFSLIGAITTFLRDNCRDEGDVNDWVTHFYFYLQDFDSHVIDGAIYKKVLDRLPCTEGVSDNLNTSGCGSTFRYVYDDGRAVTGDIDELMRLATRG